MRWSGGPQQTWNLWNCPNCRPSFPLPIFTTDERAMIPFPLFLFLFSRDGAEGHFQIWRDTFTVNSLLSCCQIRDSPLVLEVRFKGHFLKRGKVSFQSTFKCHETFFFEKLARSFSSLSVVISVAGGICERSSWDQYDGSSLERNTWVTWSTRRFGCCAYMHNPTTWCQTLKIINRTEADPGFPRQGAPIPKGHTNVFLANFPKKLHGNEEVDRNCFKVWSETQR